MLTRLFFLRRRCEGWGLQRLPNLYLLRSYGDSEFQVFLRNQPRRVEGVHDQRRQLFTVHCTLSTRASASLSLSSWLRSGTAPPTKCLYKKPRFSKPASVAVALRSFRRISSGASSRKIQPAGEDFDIFLSGSRKSFTLPTTMLAVGMV